MTSQERFLQVGEDRAFDWLQNPALRILFSLLNRDGQEVRVVGGAVRNSLLGGEVADIDCATTTDPDLVMQRAGQAEIKAIPTGLDHGTVTLLIDGQSFEVTTLRKDVETDGRHAKVVFGHDWRADAFRRDFTMNAIYLDADGRLYDPTGQGIEDAKRRYVRFIGDASERIAEDYLRVFRFFRFYAQYGGTYEALDYHACIAAQKQLAGLSSERVGSEMAKLLKGPFAEAALLAMHKGGMLAGILKSAPHLGRFARLQKLSHELHFKPDLTLLLAALVANVREDAVRLTQTFRLPNRLRDRLMRMVMHVRVITRIAEVELQKLAYEHGKQTACNLVLLAIVKRQIDPDLTELSMLFRNLDLWQIPDFPLNGRDLLDHGMKPGPELGDRLDVLEKAWIESGFVLNKQQLLARRPSCA